MRTHARTLLALPLAALLLTGLAACGDSADDDAAEASTSACRSFELVGAGDDQRLAEELQAVLAGTGGYNTEDLTARLLAVRTAATKAGLTEDLPAKQYRRFRELVDSTLRTEATVRADDDGGLDAADLSAYNRAVKAVRAACA